MLRAVLFTFFFAFLSILTFSQERKNNNLKEPRTETKKIDKTQAVGDNISFINGSTTLMEIENSGNVGIGTTNPLSLLSVGGNGSPTSTIYVENSNVGGRGIWGKASNSSATNNWGGYFSAAGTNGIGVYGIATDVGLNSTNYGGYFTAVGGAGIGVYGDAINTNDEVHYGGYFLAEGKKGRGVYGKVSGSDGFGVFGLAEGLNGYGVFGRATGENGYGLFGSTIGSNGVGVFGSAPATGYAGYFDGQVNIAGSLKVNGVNVTSDERFKKNIKPIKKTLGSLKKIKVYSYNWDTEKYPDRNFGNNKLQIGVLAQEIEKVYPDLVSTDKDGYKSVDYIKLSVITLQAVKELKNQNEELRMKNTELEKRLNKIESLLDGEKISQLSN